MISISVQLQLFIQCIFFDRFKFFPQCFGSQRWCTWWTLLRFYQANSLWPVVCIF